MGVEVSLQLRGVDFDDAVFISYTHVDDQPFGPEELHWVTHLHEQLTNRVQQVLGERVAVWKDDKLRGNDVFAEELVERLSRVAVLVSVCSPRYVKSEWCQREVDEFTRAAELRGGIQVGSKSRIFKVMKTPVPLEELPESLAPVLGYEFYEEIPALLRVREFLLSPDPEERWKFYARVDDLAQDIASLLRELAADANPSQGLGQGKTVYLAEVTSDTAQHRDRIKRCLTERGHLVVPQGPLPLTVEELTATVERDLAQSDLSIHLLGSRYGARPEGDNRSIPHIQLDSARARASADGLVQLMWEPDGLEGADEEQAALVAALRTARTDSTAVELVHAPLEDFKAYLLDRLAPAPPVAVAPQVGHGKRIYLICEESDRAAAGSVQSQLEAIGHVVVLPLDQGTEAEAREVHETELVLCDAVLIYYGNSTEHWVRMKLLDLVKARGWGRSEPFQAKAVWVATPATPHKETYSTSEVLVLAAMKQPETSALMPFLTDLTLAATTS